MALFLKFHAPLHLIQMYSCKIFELVKSVVLFAWKISSLVMAQLLHMNTDKG